MIAHQAAQSSAGKWVESRMFDWYLENFVVGPTFRSGRLTINEERIRGLPRDSIRSLFISTRSQRSILFSRAWRPVVGILLRSPRAFWLRVSSGLQAGSLGPASMRFGGHVLCGQGMNYASRARCSKCGPRGRITTAD